MHLEFKLKIMHREGNKATSSKGISNKGTSKVDSDILQLCMEAMVVMDKEVLVK